MVFDLWLVSSSANGNNEASLKAIINSLTIPAIEKSKKFTIKSIKATHLIEGSGVMCMSHNFCRALVLHPLQHKDLSTWKFSNSGVQIVFPEFVPRTWNCFEPNENLPPLWIYEARLYNTELDSELCVHFFNDNYLSFPEIKGFLEENTNWACSYFVDSGNM